jgi:parvulin-like peptidyl-prolyl isomerase
MAKEVNPKIISKKHLARLEKEKIQNRIIVTISIAILVLVVAVVGYGILDQTVLRGMKPVAVVGSDKISTTEFEKTVRYSRWQMVQQYNSTLELQQTFGSTPQFASYFQSTLSQIQYQLQDPNTVGTAVLDQLINDRLIRQEAAKRGIVVTSAEIDKAIQDWFGYFPNGQPTPTIFPTAIPTSTLSPTLESIIATLTPTIDLTATSTPVIVETPTSEPTVAPTTSSEPTATAKVEPTPTEYTFQGYRDAITKYLDRLKSTKLTEADIRRIFESSLYRQKLEDDMTKDLKPVQDQVWARHILVADEATAQKVIERFNKGENWAALAAEYSTDTSNKDNGGDLGWFGTGTMDAAFEKAAYATAVGSISAPVQSSFGWHVIQVLGHEERSLSADQFTALKDKALKTWLTDALAAAKITKTDYWKSVVPSDPNITG